MAPKPTRWEDYFVPGTSVLRNKLGITDADALKAAEEELSWARVVDLQRHPVTGDYDYAHMKTIHRHIFQDVYDWAGDQRVGPQEPQVMSKGDFRFAPVSFIEPHLTDQYRRLQQHDRFRDLNPADFTDKLADVWGEINFAHAFREGNTRAQIIFFDQFCQQAGYTLDRSAFLPGTASRDEFVAARFRATEGSHVQLREFLDTVVDPVDQPAATTAAVDLEVRRRRFPELFDENGSEDQVSTDLQR